MIIIVLEAKNKNTPEAYFVNTLIRHYYPNTKEGKDYQVIYADGKDNLSNLTPQLQSNTAIGGANVLIFDADTIQNGGGFSKRQKELFDKQIELGISFDLFLYPNNIEDGDIETLMERVARKDIHSRFFSCFEKYEMCISQEKNDQGIPKYMTPNRKGKLHTYINSMRLSNKEKRCLGKGDWLFNNSEYWDIEAEAVQPLVSFLGHYLSR